MKRESQNITLNDQTGLTVQAKIAVAIFVAAISATVSTTVFGMKILDEQRAIRADFARHEARDWVYQDQEAWAAAFQIANPAIKVPPARESIHMSPSRGAAIGIQPGGIRAAADQP